jgi:hypothetical protein
VAASTGDGRDIRSALIVPVHSPPLAGYMLPSAQQRVAPRRGVCSAQGTRDQIVSARGYRFSPGAYPREIGATPYLR